jgi:electron transfer flavoprotein alpha subunit
MAENEREITGEASNLLSEQQSDSRDVWFFVEYREGKLEEACLKLAMEASTLATKLDGESIAVIIGNQVKHLPEDLGDYGTDKAVVVEDRHLEMYTGETYVDVLAQLVELHKPSILLISASTIGNDLAPRLAARLKASLVARYTEIEVDKEGELVARRAIHGGNAQATVRILRKPLIATIDTQLLGLQKTKGKKNTQIVDASIRIDPKDSVTRVTDYLKADPCAVCVSEAEIVIGVGKGLSSVENLAAVEELAHVLGASIGGSRRATDEHWIADERRIGLTGKTISPRLYLICGISGAFHHTLSIKGSQLMVVVNIDPNAPISKMADLMIVGDMQKIIPELTKQLRELLRPTT